MSGRWKRSALLFIGAAFATAVMTAGLASAAPDATNGVAGGGRTLNIYGFGPGDDVANGRANIAERALGGASVDNPRGAFDDRAFLTRLASGDVPDLVYLDRSKVGTFAARNALLPLANCIRSENIQRNQYRAAALREVTYRGQLYALPEFTNQITIIVNNAVAQQAGVRVADIQTTNWQRLRAAARRMTRIEDNKVTRIGFDPKIPEFFPLWVKWFGADLLSKDGRRAQLNSPQAVQALTFTSQLVRDQGGWNRFKAFRDTWDFFGAKNQVAENQVGAWPMESWYYNVMADNSPNVSITAKYFTNRRGGPITFFTGSGWAIPRGARDADLACKWMKAMTSTDTWVAVAKNRFDTRKRQNRAFTGLYTANTQADVKIYEDIYQPMGRQQFDTAVRLLVQSSRYAFAMPASPAGAQVKQAWMDAINRVLEGRQSPRAALNQAQREAQRAIDDAT
jgi:multiple sugar transport system substrate-binding protein